MADSKSKPSPATPQRNGSSGKGRHPPSQTHTGSQPTTNTPTRPSTTLNSRQANSTPQRRSRPVPVRSLSTPLARSLSVRVSKKERRWSERLADPRVAVVSTYKDDYQSPEVLSLHSLNLESSVETTPGGSLSPTTYRESYKWQARRNMFHSSSRSPNPGDGGSCRNNQHGDSDSSARSNGMSSSGTLDCREQTHTGRTTQTSHTKANLRQTYLAQGQNTKVCDSVGSFGRAQGSGQRSLLKRNDSSSFKATTNGGQISSTTSIKSSASSSDDSVSVTSAREKVVPVKPAGRSEAPAPTVQASGNLQTVRESSGRGQKPSVKTEAPRVPNGTAGSGNNDSASRTEPRSRAYQLQSSTGGSPFVYGSDSGYWV